jgi:hypothetical protein
MYTKIGSRIRSTLNWGGGSNLLFPTGIARQRLFTSEVNLESRVGMYFGLNLSPEGLIDVTSYGGQKLP